MTSLMATSMKVYPNPFQREIRIQNSSTLSEPVSLRNGISNEEIVRTQTDIQNTETVLDLSTLMPGVYALTVGNKKFRVVKTN